MKIDKTFMELNNIGEGSPLEILYKDGSKELGYYKCIASEGSREQIIFENILGINYRYVDTIENIFLLKGF